MQAAVGTLPFAGVARAAFIAVQFLRSFVTENIITQEEYDCYMRSLDTVSRRMKRDIARYRAGALTREEFLKVYGHIRPGTYDIMSPRYDEAFEMYFGKESAAGGADNDNEVEAISCKADDDNGYRFSDEIMGRIQTEAEQNGLMVNAHELMTFIKEAIEGREQLKFVFTKSVSKILCLIEELGQWTQIRIPKEDMAHIDISVIKQLYVDLYIGDLRTVFSENIAHNKEQYKVVELLDGRNVDVLVAGRVVFIRSADPGWDFLFSKDIAALVTEYGGTNSHMAIRCADGVIEAVRHKRLPIIGGMWHPEREKTFCDADIDMVTKLLQEGA